jgi:glutathione synthase/RimK-type ligase-like ATP-grasp enzyme
MSSRSAHRKIVFLTDHRGFFGQWRKPWVSMDTNRIQAVLERHGFHVERHSFHEVANLTPPITDSLVFYSFSQKRNTRRYIIDLMRHLDDGTNILIPSYDLLMCHENKGFQQLYKRKVGLECLETYYFSSRDQLQGYDIHYPVVLKMIEGSNAKGVYLARDRRELLRLLARNTPQSVLTKMDLVRRRYFRRRKRHKEFPDYSNITDYYQYRDYVLNEINFVLQEFVPDLEFDYRVLALVDKCYISKRHVREGDFRASGSKRHDFDFEPEPSLLDYARYVYERFDTPFLSMDIGPTSDGYALFEFQALHFGVYWFVKSRGYYVQRHGRWVFVESKPDIETEIATALAKYVRAHGA